MWWETIAATDYFLSNMFAKHYENPTMLSKVTAKNVGDVFLRHTVESLIKGKARFPSSQPPRNAMPIVCHGKYRKKYRGTR